MEVVEACFRRETHGSLLLPLTSGMWLYEPQQWQGGWGQSPPSSLALRVQEANCLFASMEGVLINT